MANTNYSYPRVTMSTVAKKHSHNVINVPDTTIMFAPLWTEKGPDDTLVKVHTLTEFIETFGSFNEEFYNMNGQMALNVYNWLSNGGTLLVKRFKLGDPVQSSDVINTVRKTVNIEGEDDNVVILLNREPTLEEKIDCMLESSVMFSIYLKDNGLTGDTFDYKKAEIRKAYNIDDSDAKYFLAKVVNGSDISYKIIQHNPATATVIDEEPTPDTIEDTVYIYYNNREITITTNAQAESYDVDISVTDNSSSTGTVKAKYSGAYYSNLKVYIEKNKSFHNVRVVYLNSGKEIPLESFTKLTNKNYKSILSKSSYIVFDDSYNLTAVTDKKTFTFSTSSNTITRNSILEKISNFWTKATTDTTVDNYEKYLLNRLETPIDIIMDAGYPDTIKTSLFNIFGNEKDDADRPDVYLILDSWVLGDRMALPTETEATIATSTNLSVYEQYFTILDEVFTSQNIYVTPTYFLSKLIPYNDNTYGLQYPTAGLRRGILDDALAVNLNPNPSKKDEWFEARINYVEKSSREYAFMSQRTHDDSDETEYTALSFMNNSRVLEKMKKELEAIGRSYLHEFNDAITIANMSVALNKYVANWISNRTLSMGVVEVVQNEISENALDINLTIKFTNTIEVINVSIVIE